MLSKLSTNPKDGRFENGKTEPKRLKWLRTNNTTLINIIKENLGYDIKNFEIAGGRGNSFDLTAHNNDGSILKIEVKGSKGINFNKILPYASLNKSPGIPQYFNMHAKDENIFHPLKHDLFMVLPYLKFKYDIKAPLPTKDEWLREACCPKPKSPFRKEMKRLYKSNKTFKNELSELESKSVCNWTVSVYNDTEKSNYIVHKALHTLRTKMNQKDIIVIGKYATNSSLTPIELRTYPTYQITEIKLGPMKKYKKHTLPSIMYKTTLSGTRWITADFRVRRRNGCGVANLTWSI